MKTDLVGTSKETRSPKNAVCIAVTGVSGYLGSAVLDILQNDARVCKVIGFDLNPPTRPIDKLEFHQLDVTSPSLVDKIEASGATRMLHLAFILDATHDREKVRRIDIGGTQNVLTAAKRCQLQALTIASSSVVFGAHPDNPLPIAEDMQVRPDPGVQYMLDKVVVEKMALDFHAEHPACAVTVLRPVTIVGPGMSNFISRFLERGLLMVPRVKNTQWQCVHERDCARAFVEANFSGRSGIYHVAADDWYPFEDLITAMKKPSIRLPLPLMTALTELAWQSRIKTLSEVPGALVKYLCYLPIVDNSKIKRDLQFTFEYDSRRAMQTYLDARCHGRSKE
jgi:UDP-glucose 4-epimerase